MDANQAYDKSSSNSTPLKTNNQAKTTEKLPDKVEHPPVKKAPVAAKSKFTMGEDYEEETTTKKNQNQETPAPVTQPFGSNKLPTFEEIMAQEELKNNRPFNYDSD